MDKINKFIIFCFVGGIATLIDLVFFNIAFYILGSDFLMPQISRIIGIAVSMVWNFTMNRNLTFKARDEKIKKQLPRWLLVYVITSIINLIIFSIAIALIGNEFWQRNIAFVIGTGVSLVLNFIGSLFWTFKK